MTEPAAGRQNLAGAYLRLSREDEDLPESESIAGQRRLTREYMESQGLCLVKEYVDDGWSGTSFDRPAFQDLMKDCEAGKVGCIVVKDLSRLGRNYLETGRYLEQIFPRMGIRFIAVTDHYDSFQSGSAETDLVVPFKNLINDSYCRDISRKVRAQMDMKRRRGEFVGPYPGFGFIKDPKNRYHLIVDQPAADTIRLIFRMMISGRNCQAIAEHLNEIGAETPYQRMRSLGISWSNTFRPKGVPQWSLGLVRHVLDNEMFTGTVVQGKRRKVSCRVNEYQNVDRKDWIRVEGMHEPIISRETYDLVQSILARDTRTSPEQDTLHLLSGYVYCGDCGANMCRRPGKVSGKTYCYYRCSRFIQDRGCGSHNISEVKLLSAVTAAVQIRAGLLLEADELVERAQRLNGKHRALVTLNTQIRARNDEAFRFRSMRRRLSREQEEDLMEEEEVKMLEVRFARKQMVAEKAVRALQQQRRGLLCNRDQFSPWLESIRKNGEIRELSREVLVSLVDCIQVFSRDRVEIRFRFEEGIGTLLPLAEKGDPADMPAAAAHGAGTPAGAES